MYWVNFIFSGKSNLYITSMTLLIILNSPILIYPDFLLNYLFLNFLVNNYTLFPFLGSSPLDTF